MKTRETKQNDLNALTESLQNSKSAMVVTFSGLTVAKDQEFRNSLREAGAKYEVVKNTLARIAVKGTQFEGATDHFKGVTAIAWTENDPVVLSKAVSKFMKDNAAIYKFKTGVVDGKLIDFAQLNTIATLPSKEELISKLLFVLNAQAQRIVTVINAVPRDLAVVIKQIGDAKEGEAPAAEAKADEPAAAEEPAAAVEASEAPAVEEAPEAGTEATAEATAASPDDASAEVAADAPSSGSEAAAEADAASPETAAAEVVAEAPAAESEAGSETVAAAPDDAAEQAVEEAPSAENDETV
jgi:large subunit ribosomal protein L10